VRIEAGEIEAALRQHPAVRETVVMLREMNGDSRLVAYVAGVPGEETAPPELRAYLKEKLPEFMLPSAFVLLDEMPLLPSGKIDRQLLPAPELTRDDVGQPYVAPRTDVEEAVAEIWSGLLGVKQVGVHDNFFELGGHSILATRVVSRVREEFALEVPLRRLFDSPTVAGLSLAIVQQYAGQLDDEEREEVLTQLEQLSEDAAQSLAAGHGGQPASREQN
jgi:acyl carrier protein